MAQTPSNMLPLGTKAPAFELFDTVRKKFYSYDQIKGEKGTVIMFLCNHCPFVHHVIEEVVRISNDYRVEGIGFAAISSNDVVQYPQDHPDLMSEFAFEHRFNFPYFYDKSQQTARDYDAACTPDFYLFNTLDQLVYRGQLDDSRPSNSIPISGTDLRNAIDGVLYNRNISIIQKPSLGCNIKWKK